MKFSKTFLMFAIIMLISGCDSEPNENTKNARNTIPNSDSNITVQNAPQNHHLEVLFRFLQGNLNLHHQYLRLPPVQPGATML